MKLNHSLLTTSHKPPCCKTASNEWIWDSEVKYNRVRTCLPGDNTPCEYLKLNTILVRKLVNLLKIKDYKLTMIRKLL